ncbi:hypothetical protein BAUCODRAFT_27030 [Baudoinia panamericana UAMH 10762]|uniref:Purple acid phosphatase n=1 Tax=Baudoinia panamericana (strain UAMH 10762) TaxID=717646 RepID=M2M8G7_BAUPA|nr:uncharacterized protein BAUCODRAFT_27030 [Baudoinia panamericana UAMH 10762]EMC92676.1 hypothetical protein BAUCODRAFT_27030 [Baudoinia panamericana UAMH 10762]
MTKTWALLVAGAGFAAAQLATVQPIDQTTPQQVRLAYSGPNAMYVSWNTYAQITNPTVYYGTNATSLNRVASSNVSITYQTSTTYNNHVRLTGLQPNTLYYYQPQWQNVVSPFSFKTPRVAGDHTPYVAAVVVDLGTMGRDGLSEVVGSGAANPLQPGEVNTIQSLRQFKSQYDFLLHAGDLAYADYWLKEEIGGYLPNTTVEQGAQVYERILNDFYEELAPVTAYKPYMVAPGNHEANCDNGGATNKGTNTTYGVDICMPGQTNFTGYRNHFRMPSDVSGGLGNFWFSYDVGMVHFVHFDTETDLGHGFVAPDEPGGSGGENSGPFGYMNQQTQWLMADLAAVNRSLTPWIVAAGHRPWYVSVANSSRCWNCSQVFEPIFLNYSVDLVLSGHVHAYQRNLPMYANKSDPAGLNNPKYPWYITNGAAGHYDGLDTLVRPFDTYAQFADDRDYGWSRLTFHNATHMTQDFIASKNGSVIDSATLYKEHGPQVNISSNGTSIAAPSTSRSVTSTPVISSSTAASSSRATTSSVLTATTLSTSRISSSGSVAASSVLGSSSRASSTGVSATSSASSTRPASSASGTVSASSTRPASSVSAAASASSIRTSSSASASPSASSTRPVSSGTAASSTSTSASHTSSTVISTTPAAASTPSNAVPSSPAAASATSGAPGWPWNWWGGSNGGHHGYPGDDFHGPYPTWKA